MPSGARERDLEKFFSKFGRPTDVLLKQVRDRDNSLVQRLTFKTEFCRTLDSLSLRTIGTRTMPSMSLTARYKANLLVELEIFHISYLNFLINLFALL